MYTLLPDKMQVPAIELSSADRSALRDTLLEYCEWVKATCGVDEAVMDNVMMQHERFDGQGLPHGRKEDEIPEDSQTWALATAYSSNIYSRPGRRRSSAREAADSLIRQSGSSFGSAYVNLFLRRIGYY